MIQFSLQELMLFLISALGVTIGILLLPILWNIIVAATKLRHFIKFNQDSINRTFKTMPEIFENLRQISRDVKESSAKLKVSVPSVLKDIESFTNATKISIDLKGSGNEKENYGIRDAALSYKNGNPNFMDYFHSFEEISQILYHTFSSNR